MTRRRGSRSNRRNSTPGAIELAQRDYEALADFRYALRRFLGRSATAARSVGLTPQQHQALLAIRARSEADPISIGELAEQLLIRPHSGGELVERLIQAGLVERRVDAVDRRRTALFLSSRAERVLARLSAIHLEELRNLRPALRGLARQIGIR